MNGPHHFVQAEKLLADAEETDLGSCEEKVALIHAAIHVKLAEIALTAEAAGLKGYGEEL